MTPSWEERGLGFPCGFSPAQSLSDPGSALLLEKDWGCAQPCSCSLSPCSSRVKQEKPGLIVVIREDSICSHLGLVTTQGFLFLVSGKAYLLPWVSPGVLVGVHCAPTVALGSSS